MDLSVSITIHFWASWQIYGASGLDITFSNIWDGTSTCCFRPVECFENCPIMQMWWLHISLCNQFAKLHWTRSVHPEISVSPDSVLLRMMSPTFTMISFLGVLLWLWLVQDLGFYFIFIKNQTHYFSSTGHNRCFSRDVIVAMLVDENKRYLISFFSLSSSICAFTPLSPVSPEIGLQPTYIRMWNHL